MRDDDEPVDFTLQERVQERRIVAERDAAIRLTAGTEHIGMRQDPISAKHFSIVDRDKANGPNAVEEPLAQS
jgi:hypothetical protein